MNLEGPVLETLTRRLADTPPVFLAAPRSVRRGTLHVAALVNDVLGRYGDRASMATLRRFEGDGGSADDNRLSLVAVLTWLLTEEWLVSVPIVQSSLLDLLDDTAAELASVASARKFVDDPERREELARLALARLGYRPAGETVAQATDRLSSVSGTERKRLLEASRAAEGRAKAIRAALARKAAEESADKWSRE